MAAPRVLKNPGGQCNASGAFIAPATLAGVALTRDGCGTTDTLDYSNTDAVMKARAAHKSLRIGDDGATWLEAYRCSSCAAIVGEPTLACRSCAVRQSPTAFRVADHGLLYSWTVVARSYPGVAVPFVSAIVDLDGGPTMKGTLRNVEQQALVRGLPVGVRFDDAGGAVDQDGAPFVGFHFVPLGGEVA